MKRATALILFILIANGCATSGKPIPGVANFDVVQKDVLYRGGQPSPDGLKELKRRGIKTVVNLRADTPEWEKDAVEKDGMNYVLIPTLASQTDPHAIAKFLKAVEKGPRPVFVHCQLGRDRTGLEVAVWRIVECGWTRDEAIAELRQHGQQWAWFPNIERYLRSFDPDIFASAIKRSDPTAAPAKTLNGGGE